MKQYRILIVDDNLTTRKLVRMTLADNAYTIVEAEDSQAALHIVRTNPPDLILQNLSLPDMDGVFLAQQLRMLPEGRTIPILAFSGLFSTLEEARSLASVFTDFLFKPLEPSQLRASVETYLPLNQPITPPLPDKYLLVVDDNLIQAKLLKITLEQVGFQVATAVDGLDALEQIHRRPPDAIVSDILMPRMHGFQLCIMLRDTPPLNQIPILLLSTIYPTEAERSFAHEVGAFEIIARPLKLQHVVGHVHKLFTHRPTPAIHPPSATSLEEYTFRVIRHLEEQMTLNRALTQRLAQKRTESTVLVGLTEAMTSDGDLDNVLDQALQRCLDACGGLLGAIYLADEHNELAFHIQMGASVDQQAQLVDFSGWRRLLDQVLDTQELISIPFDYPPGHDGADFLIAMGIKSLILVPITSNHGICGVMLSSPGQVRVPGDILAFLSLLGRQIGQMIHAIRTLASLRASEERFSEIAENIQEVFWTVDVQKHTLIYISPGYEKIWKRPCPLPGASVNVLVQSIHPDDQRRLAERQQLEGGLSPAPSVHEYRILRPDGEVRWVRTQAITLNNAAGLSYRSVGVATDITEQKSALIALAQSEERYRSLVETSPSAIFLTDLEGTILFCNPRAALLYGYQAPNELVGKPGWQLMLGEDYPKLRELITLLLATNELQSREYIAQRVDGSRFPIELSATILLDGSQQPQSLLYILHDISDRLQADESRHAQAEAERANLAKSEFLSRMSHELRTPLNAILGFAQVLQMDGLTNDQDESLHHILKGGRHLLYLINEILDISRIESGELDLALEPVHIYPVVLEVVNIMRPLAAPQSITIRIPAVQDSDFTIIGDRQRLKQVLLNLLSNAIKYNHKDGSIQITYHTTGDQKLQIHIADTGIGIAPAHMAQLFKPFDRLGAEKTMIEGTGLGLALSRSLVEAMHGLIEARSVHRIGTTFCLEFALSPDEDPLRFESYKPIPELKQHTNRLIHILLIEDNLSNVYLIERIFVQSAGYRVTAAILGRLGIDLASKYHPDIVLLDLHLPDMHGEKVLQQLMANPATSNIPVIILTADGIADKEERLLAAGARAVLTKPMDVPALLQAIKDLL